MILGRCVWRTADGPCGFPIETFRVLPNRERLKMYPVCLHHARMVDARAAKERREASAHVVPEAEDPRGPEPPLVRERPDASRFGRAES